MAKRNNTIQIPPPVNGVTDEPVQIDSGFCLDCVNFDIRSTDIVSRLAAGDVLYEGRDISGVIPAGDSVVLCDDGELKVVTSVGAVYDIAYVGAGSTLDYAKYGDAVFFATVSGLWKIEGTSIRPAGVPRPASFPSTSGGEYSIAVSTVRDGVESGAVVIGTANIGDVLHTDVHEVYRFYIAKDSDVYRLFAEGNGDISVSDGTGAECVTLHADVFPGVEKVAWYGGRLLASAGNVVYMSPPFNPHLRDLRYGFLEFSGKVRALKPLGRGAVVADDMGIWFIDLAADKPSARRIASQLVPDGAAVSVDMSVMPAEFRVSGVGVVMLASVGHLLITPDLQVIRLTKGAVSLDINVVSSTTYVDNNECRRFVSAFDVPPSSVRRMK